MSAHVSPLVATLVLGLYALPFVPFVRSVQYMFPEIALKTFVFQALVETLAALWVWLVVRGLLPRPRATPVVVAGAVLFAVLAVSAVFGVNPTLSFWSTQERSAGLVLYAHLGVLVLVLQSARHHLHWERFLGTSIAAAVLLASTAIVQRYWVPDLFDGQGRDRPGGFFGNPSLLAGYLLFHWFFAGWLCLRKFAAGQRRWGFLLASSAVPILFAIFIAETRGALAGLLAGMVSLAAWGARVGGTSPVRGRLTLRTLAGATLLSFVLLVATFAATRSAPVWKRIPGVARLTDLTLSSPDVATRWEPLKLCFEALPERPLLGFGYENFRTVFDAHYRPQRFNAPEMDKPHNIIGEHLVTTGAVGFLSYLGFLVTLGVALVRSTLPGFAPFGLAALIAYFVQNIVLFDTLGPLLALSWLTACADAGAGEALDTKVRLNEPVTSVLALLAAVVALIGVAANFSILRANRGQRWARGHLQYGNPERAYASHGEARRVWFNPYRLTVHQGFVQALEEAHFRGVSLSPERNRRVLDAFRRAIDNEPGDYPSRVAYAHALGVLDATTPERLAEAAKILQEAAVLSPGRPGVHNGLSSVRILQHDWPAALAVGETILRLSPKSGDAHFAHGLVAFEAQDTKRGLRSIETAASLGRTPRDGVELRVVADHYAEVHNYARAATLYKQALDLDPADLASHWKLGLAHYHAGDHDAARQILQNVAKTVDVRTALPYELVKPVFDELGVQLP